MIPSLIRLVTAAAFVASSVACGRVATPAEAASVPAQQQSAAPKLIVFITVDQLRADMLDRYRSELKFGFARLLGGARFVNGFQDQAITETAPGHAAMMSGRFPSGTNILSDADGFGDQNFSLIDADKKEWGGSPVRFRGTTLFDWLSAKDRATRALSVSMKDRSAIGPIGKAKQDVYWYSVNGNFTTSTYYRDTLPKWVRDFNARRIPASYAGAEWRLLRDSTLYPEPDLVQWEKKGDNVFPHVFPDDTARATDYIRSTPTMDSVTALFALEGLRQTGIGRAPHTDILNVSFSATDIVGHSYGPDSREAHDNELRLDQTIGWFLDSLYKLRDSSTVMIAFTADHGIQPIPELARERGEATGDQGLRVSLRDLVASTRASLRAAGADPRALDYNREMVGLDRPSMAGARLKADSVLDAFSRAALAVRGVARVDRIADLRKKADLDADPIGRRWVHEVPIDEPVDLVITLTKYSYWNSLPATHGSPYDQDASVPIIFYGPWVKPGRYTTFARVVDMGTTLAAIAGVKPAERVDGVVLKEVIR